jgi:hypothetical protein
MCERPEMALWFGFPMVRFLSDKMIGRMVRFLDDLTGLLLALCHLKIKSGLFFDDLKIKSRLERSDRVKTSMRKDGIFDITTLHKRFTRAVVAVE